MYFLYVLTALAVLVSYILSRDRTHRALVTAVKKFLNIIPAFATMLIFVSIILFLVPDRIILNYLGNTDKVTGVFFASFFGSVTLMPGFIAFPLAGILLGKGVSYMVLSAFTTTLMMVGVLTFPIEKEYFGVKVAIIRNMIGLFIALSVSVATGIFFGEIF